jgi:hypothetical protein
MPKAKRRKRRVTLRGQQAQLQALTARVEALEEKGAGIDSHAAALADAITREIRAIVEGEADDLLDEVRLTR